jgi:hypothetical protein
MATAEPTNVDQDSSSVPAITGRFLSAWQQGNRPALDDYLPAGTSERMAVLPRLVLIDLQSRLRAGEMACVEAYLGRYADLAANPAAVQDLLVAEYDERKRRQPDLTTDEYFRRFPQYREELARRLGSAPAPPAPAAATAATPIAASSAPAPVPAAAPPVPAPTPAPRAELGTLLPGTVEEWMSGPERLRDAAMMAIFNGVLWALLCLACLAAVFQQHEGGGAVALAVTVCLAAVAAFHFWIAPLTRARRIWAIWAGLIVALFVIYEILRFLFAQGFHFDAFANLVCVPLFLMAVIQALAFSFAVHAHYRNPQEVPGAYSTTAGQ